MIDTAVKTSKIYTALIRIGCYILMVLAICMFFSPVTTLLGYIPLVGGLLKGTTGFIIFLAAVIICIPIFIIAFSLAWLWYHPKVGIIILGVGLIILGVILAINYTRKGKSQEATAAISTAGQTTTHLLRYFNHFS
jgi:hypothetical protein